MIKPTVGRVVWYRTHPSESIAGNDGSQPLAAIIAYVHTDTCVNLTVLDANGAAHSKPSVLLKHEDADLANFCGPYCEWMPYQKGQAAKTEALELAAQAGTVRSGIA